MRIAVIGAGLSGLTFAAAAKQVAPAAEVSLYERDASPSSRTQGYAIGLRNGYGLEALDGLGLRASVIGQDAYKVTDFAILDQRGKVLLSLPSGKDGPNVTYRIQRMHLKEVLRQANRDAPISFGKHCSGFQQTPTSVTAIFEDQSSVEAEYLVACDGAGSEIRQQLVGDHKRYLGLNSIHFESRLEVDHPFLAGGYFLMLGNNGCSFFCYRQPGGVYWSYVVHATSEAETAAESGATLLQRVRDETTGWHELVRTIVGAAVPETSGVRGYYDKEPISSALDGRVWMIGDAAHPMCPFQGQGANMAIMDAVLLARLFGGAYGEREAAQLNEDIVKRGREHVLESRGNAKRFHETSTWRKAQRNFAFRVGNFFISTFARRK